VALERRISRQHHAAGDQNGEHGAYESIQPDIYFVNGATVPGDSIESSP
jgi:hypothetical protein